MKKPKKTLKDLGRIEDLLAKQTARSAKLLARRKTGDAENPVTAGYYDRIAAHHAAALADLSEIVHLTETLSRQIVEKDGADAARKAAKKAAKTPETAGKAVAKPAAKTAPRKEPVKTAAVKVPVKTAGRAAVKTASKTDVKRPARRTTAKTATA